jgi:hypothetical protein
LLFIILSTPYSYQLSQISGINTLSPLNPNCPTLAGLIINGTIYAVILRLLLSAKEDKNCETKFTSKDKWIVSIIGGVLFLLLASPYLFGITDNLSSLINIKISDNGCPNSAGIILHGIIFALAVRLLMY